METRVNAIKGTHNCRRHIPTIYFFIYYILFNIPTLKSYYFSARVVSCHPLQGPRKQHRWTHFLSAADASRSTSPAAQNPFQASLSFVQKEASAIVGRDHRRGTISNNTWLLWRRGRLQGWDFSSNEGRLPGAGVWDRPSLTLACETIKAKEICYCRSTQRCEKRAIKLEEHLFYVHAETGVDEILPQLAPQMWASAVKQM